MSFKSIIEGCYSEYLLNEPANPNQIKELIHQVGVLPEELHNFLLESDGAQLGDMVCMFSIEGKTGYTFSSVIAEWQDPEYETLYPNSQNLLFFADDSMGNFFGYERFSNEKYGKIYYWDHEEDSITEIVELGLTGFIRTCEQYIE